MKFVLATGVYPPEIGGPAKIIERVSRELHMDGHDVLVVTYGAENERADGLIHVSRHGNVLVRYLRFFLAIRSTLAPETIVVATDVFSVGIPARLALIGRSNHLLLRLGGEWRWERAVENGRTHRTLREFWEQPTCTMRDSLELMSYRWILRRAQRIAVTSHLLQEILARTFHEIFGRIIVVSNVVSSVALSCRPDGPPRSPLRLLYVGRFVRVKNLPFLAKILQGLVRDGVNIACTWIGDGPTLEEIRTELKGLPNMRFLGAKNSQDVQDMLTESDVLVLPSLTDICPNIVLEALAARVPCILTTEHGLQAPLSGVIECDPRNAVAWTQAIKSLTDTHAYETLRTSIRMPDTRADVFHDWLIGARKNRLAMMQ